MRRLLVAMLVASLGCGPNQRDPGGGGDDDDDEAAPDARRDSNPFDPDEFADAAPLKACTKMDFLFVVDNSGSMQEEQTNLGSNFPHFVQVINEHVTSAGDQLDYRLALTTTGRDVHYSIDPGVPGFPPFEFEELGDDGEFRGGCGQTRRWLERADSDVTGAFTCRAQVGTNGPGIEMPLLATELALSPPMSDGANAGFLREDALLAIVLLTDEDDCSRRDDDFTISTSDACDPSGPLVPPAETIAFLDGLKGARGRWATAVVAGPGPGTCSSSFGDAADAVRLKQFVGDVGTNAVFSSICEGDLTMALNDALATFEEACESFPDID